MISGFVLIQFFIFSATVFPVHVIISVFIRSFLFNSFIRAYTPPASSSSSIYEGPAGARWHRFGVLALTSLAISKSNSIPTSWAIAGKCSILFVLQPNAISTASAFIKASSVIISLGLISLSNNSIICIPACFAN